MKRIQDSTIIKSNNRIYYSPDDEQKKIYHNIKMELENKLNINVNSRDLIIKRLISFLTQGDYNEFSTIQMDLTIIRTDIENFFPSVNKHTLYRKFNNLNILKRSSFDILKEFLFNKKIDGIPLGLGFSNHLAEFYLSDFDKDIKKAFKPEAYFRYVDDIIIVSCTENIEHLYPKKHDIENKLDVILQNYDLRRNHSKTEIKYIKKTEAKKKQKVIKKRTVQFNDNMTEQYKADLRRKVLQAKKTLELKKKKEIADNTFDFLGYQFTIYEGRLNIGITPAKRDKSLRKIQSIFKKFKKHPSDIEFWKLYYKIINIIYGITSVNSRNKKLKFGLGYNYRYINDSKALKPFLSSIKKLIFSCNLSSSKRRTLLNIITCENDLELLNKRFNYLKLTNYQKNIIKRRLDITIKPPSNAEKFSSAIFHKLYQ